MALAQKKPENLFPVVFLSLAVILGSFVRLSSVFGKVFPLNDGGLFYTMTSDLIVNGFKIPTFTTYNHLEIPFAYPPLQFFIAGLLSTVFKWSLLDIFRILPALVSCLCIPAVYLLARELLHNDLHASLTSLIYALTPASFDWLIMGGGITRAPAFLFALCTLVSIYRLYTRKEKRYVLITAVLASLTVLSHPETALHTAASALVFLLIFGRNKLGILRSLITAAMVFAFTSPWWVVVVQRHGLTPFTAAGQTGWHNLLSIFKLFFANQLSEYNLTPITILAIIGLFFMMAQKKYFLPIWFFAIFISEPRSAPLYMSPVIAIFATVALIQILKLLNNNKAKPIDHDNSVDFFLGKFSKVFFAIVFSQWVFSAYGTVINLSNYYYLDSSEMKAFNWVKENTPPESRFLVLSGNAPLTDPLSEWFPALTERISQGTAQGHEWLKGNKFDEVLEEAYKLQFCSTLSSECVANWSQSNSLPYDYLFIDPNDAGLLNGSDDYQNALSGQLSSSNLYQLVYDHDGITIFKVENP